MQRDEEKFARNQNSKAAGHFILGLASVVVVSTASIIGLLCWNSQTPNVGTLVILAGLGGIIGSSLNPLLEQKNTFSNETSSKANKNEENLTIEDIHSQSRHIFSLIVMHIAGGCLVSAAAFIITSALLFTEPGKSTSVLGTVAYSGVVGFVVGRAISRQTVGGKTDQIGAAASVMSALGGLEDQLFGRPLVNYDGDLVVESRKTDSGPLLRGKIIAYMISKEYKNYPQSISSGDSEHTIDSGTGPITSARGRVLIQGGRDADLVPFAISIVSGALNIQPYRRILVAPIGGKSEQLEFTILSNIDLLDVEKEAASEAAENATVAFLPEVPGTKTAEVLIDVSQSGQTVQVLTLKIYIDL